jgi:hypothetical protein
MSDAILKNMITRILSQQMANEIIGGSPLRPISHYETLGLLETETVLGDASQVARHYQAVKELRARYGS